jgi:glutamate synthase (NADPH) small chain
VYQDSRNNIVTTSEGISTHDNWLVKTDEFGKTSSAGIFASGDIATSAKTVIEAVRLSKNVADSIEEYILSCK